MQRELGGRVVQRFADGFAFSRTADALGPRVMPVHAGETVASIEALATVTEGRVRVSPSADSLVVTMTVSPAVGQWTLRTVLPLAIAAGITYESGSVEWSIGVASFLVVVWVGVTVGMHLLTRRRVSQWLQTAIARRGVAAPELPISLQEAPSPELEAAWRIGRAFGHDKRRQETPPPNGK
jgi:hypothetical protein